MTIYLELFIGFLIVGCFSFGGAYGSIALIREVVLRYGWLNEEILANMIGISESTPGPIMVNLATYIGSSQGGVLGAIIATFAVALPSFLIILIVMILLKKMIKNDYFQALLSGLNASVIGIVTATGLYMILNSIFNLNNENGFEFKSLITFVSLMSIYWLYYWIVKKKMSPILLIMLSGIMGILLF